MNKVHFDELKAGGIYTVNCSGVVQCFRILSIENNVMKQEQLRRGDGMVVAEYKPGSYLDTSKQEWESFQEGVENQYTEYLFFEAGDDSWKDI